MLDNTANCEKSLSLDTIDDICQFYHIGRPIGWKYSKTSLLKLNTVIETASGRYFLKDYGSLTDCALGDLQFVYQVISYVAAGSIPVPYPLQSVTNQPWYVAEDHFFMLFPSVYGEHIDGPQLNAAQSEHLGSLVAQLHSICYTFENTGEKMRVYEPPEGERTLQFIREFEALIPQSDPIFTIAQSHFALVKNLLEQKQLGPVQSAFSPWLIHHDLTPSNILWRGNHITAILDWDDNIIYGTRVLDIAHLMNWFFWNDPHTDWEKVALFLRSYHSCLPLTRTEIAALIDTYYWDQVHDLWVYKYFLKTREAHCLEFAHDSYSHLWWLIANRNLLQVHLCATLLY